MDQTPVPNCPGRRPGQFGTGCWSIYISFRPQSGPKPPLLIKGVPGRGVPARPAITSRTRRSRASSDGGGRGLTPCRSRTHRGAGLQARWCHGRLDRGRRLSRRKRVCKCKVFGPDRPPKFRTGSRRPRRSKRPQSDQILSKKEGGDVDLESCTCT